MELPYWVQDELEEPISRIFEIMEPVGSRLDPRLRSHFFYCFRDNLGLYCSEHVF